MFAVITVVHIVACLFLISVVLLQQGKGADMGAVFGGSSQTLFGSGGAGNFLTRLTTAMAVVFMATSLTLAYGSARRVTTTIFDDAPLPEAPISAPAAPAPDAAAEPAPQAESAPAAEAAPQPEAAPQAAAEKAAAATADAAAQAAAGAEQAVDAALEKPAEAAPPAQQ